MVWQHLSFLVFGALSDKIGRKWIMLTGMLLGVVCYRPIFNELIKNADAKEWETRVEGMSYVKIEGQKNPLIKIDTIKRADQNLLVTHVKETWQLKEGLQFTKTYADTAGLLKADTAYLNMAKQQNVYQANIEWVSKDKKPVTLR